MAAKATLRYSHVDTQKLQAKIKSFGKEYYKAMIKLMQDAAEEFVWRTVQEVSIDTGMSAASLEPLAEEVGSSIIGDVTPFIKHSQRSWGTAMSGLSQKGRIRSIDAGIQAGRAAFKFNFGSEKRPHMVFEFRINVWQYAFWEKNWRSLEVGLSYFIKFINDNYDDYIPENIANVLNAYTYPKD